MEYTVQHQMELTNTFATGAEEWHCHQCERHFVARWQPHYKRIILHEGDLTALHMGNKGGLQFKSAQVEEEDTNILSPELRDALNDLLDGFDFGD